MSSHTILQDTPFAPRTSGLGWRGPLLALAGVGLLGATVLQARAVSTPAASAPAPSLPGHVAAEGRLTTYPGAEVRLSAERGGRLVRVLVEEGKAVRKGQAVAEIESEELRASRAAAQARVAEAEAEIRLAEANRERLARLVDEQILASSELDRVARDLDTTRARRESAQAELARLDAQLRKSLVVSPLDGTVIARSVDPGETIDAGTEIAAVADLSRLRVEAEADEADAAAVVVGAPVEVKSDAYPGQSWRGHIEEVGQAVTTRKLKPQDPGRPTDTRVLNVKVALDETTPLRLGTTVDVKISETR